MIIPIRCMNCGRPVAQLWEAYKKRVAAGEEPKGVLDELGVKSYCCRATLLTHVEIAPKLARHKR